MNHHFILDNPAVLTFFCECSNPFVLHNLPFEDCERSEIFLQLFYLLAVLTRGKEIIIPCFRSVETPTTTSYD